MRLWLGVVLVGGLLLGLGSRAEALIIDDFSVGAFSLTDSGAGTTSTQACGSFCLGGTREVFLQGVVGGAPATAQLAAPPGEMQTGGDGSFSFTVTVDTDLEPVDLTRGGTATQVEVWFTTFAPGAAVSMTLVDSAGASQTASNPDLQNPIFINPLSAFAPVDLQNVTEIQVSVQAPATGGDYHITLIRVPEPGPSTANVLGLPGATVTAGPAFPSAVLPVAVFRPEPDDQVLVMDIDFSLMNATNAAGPISANAVGISPPDDTRVVFLATTLPSGPTNALVQWVLRYQPPAGIAPPDDTVPVLNWIPGNNWFEVKVDVGVPIGQSAFTAFTEKALLQTFNITNVTAVKGSIRAAPGTP